MVKERSAVIALAQIKYFDSFEKHNVRKIKRYIQLAKKKKADIICFPESCVHKNDFMSFNHKLIKEIKEECKKHSIWCILNDDMVIRGKLYNTTILIDRKGKIRGHYRKIHLYGDSEGVIPGKKPKIFETDFAKIGIAVCWDLAYPNLFKKMKKKGAEIIFCPVSWRYEVHAYGARKYEEKHKKKEKATLKSLVMTRAFENILFVALCSPAGKEEDLVSYSAICSPHKILAEIKNKEGLIVSKINLDEIEKLHKVYGKFR